MRTNTLAIVMLTWSWLKRDNEKFGL